MFKKIIVGLIVIAFVAVGGIHVASYLEATQKAERFSDATGLDCHARTTGYCSFCVESDDGRVIVDSRIIDAIDGWN